MMHPRVFHERTDAAQARTRAAVQILGGEDAVARLDAAFDRDPQIRALQEREVIADVLEGLAKEAGNASDLQGENATLRDRVEALEKAAAEAAAAESGPENKETGQDEPQEQNGAADTAAPSGPARKDPERKSR